MTTRLSRGIVLGALPLLVLTGCGFKGAQSFPLPGGVATGDDAYEVTIEFQDVLDLVEQSSVKVDDVTVGSVSGIELSEDGQNAMVTVRVRDDVVLPANATASLRQTSLLGEKFVSLDAPPAEQRVGSLRDVRDQPTIALDKTTRNVEIEELLSALSLVLNGGGLEQLQVINREITLALKGRETEVKDLLTQLDTFVGGLDDQKADIVRALDSLDRLTARLSDQRAILATALEDLPGGARILADQRASLTRLLTGLDELGDVSVRVIDASQANTVADLQALQPILSGLNDAGTSLPGALELLTTYPFPKTIDTGIRGDYANLYATIDLGSALENPLPPPPGPLGELPPPPSPDTLPVPTLPGVPGATATPPLSGILPQVPGLTVPGQTGSGGTSTAPNPSVTALTQLLLGGMR